MLANVPMKFYLQLKLFMLFFEAMLKQFVSYRLSIPDKRFNVLTSELVVTHTRNTRCLGIGAESSFIVDKTVLFVITS